MRHLHRLKIIHRDLKPQNCLLADAGGRLTIKLCDFGLSRVLSQLHSNSGSLPRPGAEPTTPQREAVAAFMSVGVDGLSDPLLPPPAEQDAAQVAGSLAAEEQPPAPASGILCTANVGTVTFMAPEVMSFDPNGADRISDFVQYTLAADVFSCGVLFWVLATLRHPFEGCNEVAEVIRAVMSGERPGATPDDPMCPPALRSLIDACWSKEPHNRPTMEAVHDAVAAIPKIDRRSGMLSSPLP